jgi:DNA-directed RNA polymerase subunit RPC12/RpoP
MVAERSDVLTAGHDGDRTMCLATANLTIWRLLDNSEAEDAEDYLVTCDDCGALITDDEYSANNGLCGGCNAAVHFTCGECKEAFHVDDRSDEFPLLCTDCGSAKHTELADGLWSELEDLAGSWSGEDFEIGRLRKLLAYAKRLK